MWSFSKRIFLTLSACFVVTLLMAQPKNNSPYSRFGVGDILNQNFANLRATPGFTNAYNNAYHLNLQNPASLGFMQMAAFDFGVYGVVLRIFRDDGECGVVGECRFDFCDFIGVAGDVDLAGDCGDCFDDWDGGGCECFDF